MALPDFGDETAGKSWGHRATRQIHLSWDNSLAKEETFSLKVSPAGILIQARKSAGFARALVAMRPKWMIQLVVGFSIETAPFD